MVKVYSNFSLFVLGVLLITIVACADSDVEVKELNKNQLNEVINTLYIDKISDKKNDITQKKAEDLTKAIPNNTLVKNAIKNQIISNENGLSSQILDASQVDISTEKENSSDTRASTNDALNTIAVIDSSPTEDFLQDQAEDSLQDQAEGSLQDQAEGSTEKTEAHKIATTNFSQPITESETPAETILKKLLEKFAVIDYSNAPITSEEKVVIDDFCQKISKRLSSVSLKLCIESNHRLSPFTTAEGLPIVISEFAPKPERKPLGKILVIGGTHGDELTSVSTTYQWISNLNKYHSGLFHWHIAPALNADSVLKRPAIRQNANGVDINRNLPTPDWEKQSTIRWDKLKQDPRKSPGNTPASESETQWIMHEIATFKPDAIVSIHAPYGILDFDGPKLNNAPKNFGRLQLNLLGTYPGSLGNYAGIQQKIPVLTLELPNATSMPSQKELAAIWNDMIKWLRNQLSS